MHLNSLGVVGWARAFGLALVLCLVQGTTAFARNEGTYTTFDAAQGASWTVVEGAYGGDVVGEYLLDGRIYGFLRKSNGDIVTINPTGSTGANADGVNLFEDVVGAYTMLSSTYGFVQYGGGEFDNIIIGGQYTTASGINENKDIVGTFGDGGTNPGHGYLLPYNGSPVVITEPKAGTQAPGGTVPELIDDKDNVAGYYFDKNDQVHGFFRSAQNIYTSIDIPGGGSGIGHGTYVTGLNKKHSVVGYVTNLVNTHGYIWTPVGYQLIGVNKGNSLASAINDQGFVVGSYVDSALCNHGFYLTPHGRVKKINVPGAGAGRDQGTTPMTLDELGYVGGYYTDSGGVLHGFLWHL